MLHADIAQFPCARWYCFTPDLGETSFAPTFPILLWLRFYKLKPGETESAWDIEERLLIPNKVMMRHIAGQTTGQPGDVVP